MRIKERKIKKLLEEYRDHAEKNGFRLNPNKEITNNLIEALIEREEKYGKRYCPCRRVKGKKEDEEIVCPCSYHKEEIREKGHCHCFLFVK